MTIGTQIKKARLAKKLTQAELAEKIGVKKTAVSNYENGVSAPNEPTLLRLMRVLDVDANYIYADYFNSALDTPQHRAVTKEEAEFLNLYSGADPIYREIALDILRTHQKNTKNEAI